MTLAVETKSAGLQRAPFLTFERAQGSIDALDGLRMLAIALVLLRHAMKAMESQVGSALEITLPWGVWSFATPLMNGWMGVDLFFVLSGFLIGSHLIRHRSDFSTASLGRYFGARALRIVPTYFAVILLVAIGFFPLYKPMSEDMVASVIWHMLFLQDYLPSDLIVAFWSLGVEEKFYMVAPLLILGTARLGRLRNRIVAYGVLLILPMLFRWLTLQSMEFDFTSYRAYFETFRSPFHLTYEGLLIGVICAEFYACRVCKERFRRFAKPMLAIGVGIIGAHLIPVNLMAEITLYDVLLQPVLLSIGFGLILLATALINPKSGWAASRFSLIGARLSYSLYLVHMALIPAAMVPALLSGAQGVMLFAIFFAAFMALSLIASLALHFVVEKPFLQLKSRLF
ncbi:MAG: acyltransferase [Rhizobiaceae bacterium]|nr:acyltransferase [Rhizobiaceae bacterium]